MSTAILALALTAFELAWVDGGAATSSMAGHLGLAPIHEKGTPEQKQEYMSRAVPPQPGENRAQGRAAFCLTEPLPYVGVDTGDKAIQLCDRLLRHLRRLAGARTAGG